MPPMTQIAGIQVAVKQLDERTTGKIAGLVNVVTLPSSPSCDPATVIAQLQSDDTCSAIGTVV